MGQEKPLTEVSSEVVVAAWSCQAAVCFLVLGLCAAPSWAGANIGDPILSRSVGQRPELGVAASAAPGDAVLEVFDYTEQAAVRLNEAVSFGRRFELQAGSVLLGYSTGRLKRYCLVTSETGLLGPPEAHRCLEMGSGGAFTDRYTVPVGGGFGNRRPLDSPPSFESVSVEVPTDEASQFGRMYRQELVYQGAAGGVLRLQYREYVDSLARPAFAQEFAYDIPEDGEPFVVVAKGARLRISSAGNEGVSYELISTFGE